MCVRNVVEFLGKRGIVRQQSTSTVPVSNRRVVEFQDWLRRHRGVSVRTIGLHGRMVMLRNGADHTTIAMHDQPARRPLSRNVNRVR
jgi:hypothetical protein